MDERNSMDRCVVHRLGRMAYDEAWQLQERLAGEIARGNRPPSLLLLEHPHTYTFGRRAHAENLLWDAAELERREVSLRWVDRGGDVTYHGPGQLVGYPLLPLAQPGWPGGRLPQADFVGYLRKLEETLILALFHLGVPAGQRPGLTGVWVQADVASRCPRCDPSRLKEPAKVASIGVKVDAHGVSRHGFALNVDPQMEYWEGIIPCGLKQVTMLSLADLLNPVPTLGQVMDQVTAAFGEVFGCEMAELSRVDSV
ncbi:MAG: lipoyl(octanoyl) transferase LipB [Chloroflexi bacterium]|nr:lipoyl(octanoyl) transferase LipB [Chloroflexota bacterium]